MNLSILITYACCESCAIRPGWNRFNIIQHLSLIQLYVIQCKTKLQSEFSIVVVTPENERKGQGGQTFNRLAKHSTSCWICWMEMLKPFYEAFHNPWCESTSCFYNFLQVATSLSNPIWTAVESRFFESSIFRTSRFFEPWHVSIGFASVKHCNFTPDFSNLQFFETPDISNQFLPPMEEIHEKFTFDFSSLHEIFNVLLRSFHLNGHTSQTQKVEPPSITQ